MSSLFRHTFTSVAALCLLLTLTTACEDSTSGAGGSLIEDRVEIVMDSTFTVTGRSVAYDRVQSRTTVGLLGAIDADGFGRISSDIVTQYMPSASIQTDHTSAENIDSVKMVLSIYHTGFTGDSLMPMGLRIYPLKKQLPSPIYSSFDPDSYVDKSTLLGSSTYSTLFDGAPNVNADENGTLYKSITIDLPRSIGVSLYNQYLNAPATFNNPAAFAEYFPGVFITNTFGSGRITRIDNNIIQVYYHQVIPKEETGKANDSIVKCIGNYMGVTPEIISNNNIRYTIDSRLRDRAESGENILVAPLGYDVEFTFPAREIIEKYKTGAGNLSVINSLTLSIPVEEIQNDFGITPPPYVLLVKKSKKDEFFDKIQINDDVTSFYASYNSATRSYDFTSMRDYIMSLLSADEITDDDVEFVITPVVVAFYENQSSSSYSYYYYSTPTTTRIVAKISPYVSQPVMAKLKLDKAKINFTYSKQSIKF